MIENWIDAVAKVFEISDGQGGLVKSFRVFEKDEFPNALSQFPSAISYPTGVQAIYGEASMDIWTGITEIHVDPVEKSNLADVLRYVNRIKTAVAANITLGGLVSYFILDQDGGQNIVGPVTLDFGDPSPNTGFIVHWTVKENTAVIVGG
jgi:hypothetical protein